MRRRFFVSGLVAATMALVMAGTALGADCINNSKPDGAGQHVDVILGPDGSVSFTGTNANGRLRGGFADVWVDFDGDGVGDLQVIDDTFLVANHSGRANPAQGADPSTGTPAALPQVLRGADPAGPDHGVGHVGSE